MRGHPTNDNSPKRPTSALVTRLVALELAGLSGPELDDAVAARRIRAERVRRALLYDLDDATAEAERLAAAKGGAAQ